MNLIKVLTPKICWTVPVFASTLIFAAPIFDPESDSSGAMQPVGYVGQPIAAKYALDSRPTALYIIDYSSIDWSGDLHAYSMAASGTINKNDTSIWAAGSAGTQLDAIAALPYNATRRNIVTWNGNSGVPFALANLSVAQKTAVGGQAVLDFIRGDTTNEAPNGLNYRNRGSVLGDIIHSTPLRWKDGTNETVFVGANDGMLHAFNALTGAERFAYIPSQLISKLPNLKDPAYVHKYFVDGQLAARKFGTRSILVGALGGGGKGLFGIDVTAVPTDEVTAASKILWEISNASTNYGNLGHVFGTPLLTTLPSGENALIVGNGYNNTGNGRSSLFIINPATGARIAEINAGTGTTTAPNGLSSPTLVDTNFDGKSDFAYAGDIDGNLWKFDLAANTATLLYTTNPVQAITMAPVIKDHPLGGRMVNFVTGKNFTATDETDSSVHYAYGIWDRPAAYANNNTLLEQALSEVTYTGATPNIRVRTATSSVPDWTPRASGRPTTSPALGTANNMGWRTPLSTTSPAIAGERVVGDGAILANSAFMFLTSNPTLSPNTTPPGANWWMQLNALTGGDNNAIRFDLNGDAQFTSADSVSSLSPVGQYIGGGVRSQFTSFSTSSGLGVYQANYDRNGDPPTPVGRGVSGGHFDVDVYYSPDLVADRSTQHKHEYDDLYDVTGLNMLNASNSVQNLSNAITDPSTQFKVIAHNQYLSPAARLHLQGTPSYVFDKDRGYIDLKTYSTQADVAALQASLTSYTLSTVQSLAVNFPVDAFAQRNWWRGDLGLAADVRVGLHPTQTGCVKEGDSSNGGNLFQPVTPPARVLAGGTITGTGNGTIPSPRTSGVRHNGALTIQVIKAATTNDQLEMNVSGSPEYGWRVKSADFATQVLAEYTIFWHHNNRKCYGESGWTKEAPEDTTAGTGTATKASGSTDPKIGAFGSGTGTGSGIPTVGTTTTTNPTTGAVTTTVTVLNSDGSYTITATDRNPTTGAVTTTVTVLNSDGSYTITTNGITAGGGTSNSIDVGGIVDGSGVMGSGMSAPLAPVGRLNWKELRR